MIRHEQSFLRCAQTSLPRFRMRSAARSMEKHSVASSVEAVDARLRDEPAMPLALPGTPSNVAIACRKLNQIQSGTYFPQGDIPTFKSHSVFFLNGEMRCPAVLFERILDAVRDLEPGRAIGLVMVFYCDDAALAFEGRAIGTRETHANMLGIRDGEITLYDPRGGAGRNYSVGALHGAIRRFAKNISDATDRDLVFRDVHERSARKGPQSQQVVKAYGNVRALGSGPCVMWSLAFGLLIGLQPTWTFEDCANQLADSRTPHTAAILYLARVLKASAALDLERSTPRESFMGTIVVG
jgi:hypothetical protein